MGKNIKILVATHKKYNMPKDDIYFPIQVGREGKEEDLGYNSDNVGDNISFKNPYYCELTGIYWAWKNLDADYIGLSHYRRHFTFSKRRFMKKEKKLENVLNREDVEKILENTDIILPKKRKYYIENLYSHYKHTTYIEPLEEAGKIIKERYPEYSEEFEKLHKRTSAHMFNMFIMKKEMLDKYCIWVFDILFELEKRVDVKKYDDFHSRFFGRISELLLDVWINTNNLSYQEVRVMDIDHINWFKKGIAFLMAKYAGKKYIRSF